MSINKNKTGNLVTALLKGHIDVLVHGANCFCTMGAGIALEIKTKIPGAYAADSKTKFADSSKLGSYSKYEFDNKTVINLYSQYNYRGIGPNVNYQAIKEGFEKLNSEYKDKNLIFGIPLIGCGLAGGDWSRVAKIINESTPDLNIILYEFKP